LIEFEHGDNFLIVIPATPGYAAIRLLVDRFGKLVIKGGKRNIEVQY